MSATATAAPPKAVKKLGVFRLNYGGHEQTAEGWEWPLDKDGKRIANNEDGTPIVPRSTLYLANDPNRNIVRSEIDLVAKFGKEKFTRLSGDPSLIDSAVAAANEHLLQENQASRERIAQLEAKLRENGLLGGEPAPEKLSEEPGLINLTLAQLKVIALDEGVDASDCRTKADYVAAIELKRSEADRE